MKQLKKDNPRITFRPSERLHKKFRRACFDRGLSQDFVLLFLIKRWLGVKYD